MSVTYQPLKGSAEEWSSFDEIAPNLAIGRLPLHWVDQVERLSFDKISSDVASADTMAAVLNHNADAFFGMFALRKDGGHSLEAYFAQLLLTRDGHRALLDRSIDLKNPPLDLLVTTGERPDAVYLWGMVAQRKAAIFQPYLKRNLRLLSGLTHYATLATHAGLRAGLNMGLTPVPPDSGHAGDLFVFPSDPRIAAHEISVRIVSSAEHFEQARAVRAAVFMQEQLCPYDEEFDGNDYSAQHVIGYLDGAPAATIRIRYFASFAKLERFAVLNAFRKTPLKDELIRFALEIVSRKGYREVYGHAQTRLLYFWKRRGFEQTDRQSDLRFSDHDYVEIRRSLPVHRNALSTSSDAMILNRPEGAWDAPGILEASRSRPVTRPTA